MTSIRLKLLAVSLIIVLFYLQYRLWFDVGGLRDLARLKEGLAMQSVETDRLKQRNQELLEQIHRLKNSEEAAEARARNELGMIKKDETFYQIIDKRNTNTAR